MTSTRSLSVLAALMLAATLAVAQESDSSGADAAAAADASGAGPTEADATASDSREAVAGARDETRRQEIDARAQATLNDLLQGIEGASGLYDRSAGYAVFTAMKAGGFFVTGGRGTGVAIDKASGQHTYMRLGTGGLGFGLGAQRYDLVILFETTAQLERFIQGGWDASASAQAAAGSDGVAVSSSFVDGVAFFQMTNRGLMAQADITGTRFWPIDDLNQ